MTNSLADALPKEIVRVSAKRDRWRDMMREVGMPGMALSIRIMESAIQNAVEACASGDVAAMLDAYEFLKDYSDDD